MRIALTTGGSDLDEPVGSWVVRKHTDNSFPAVPAYSEDSSIAVKTEGGVFYEDSNNF